MIKPYYENENGRLYCANCLDVMPELEGVDLTVTSPPYGNLRDYDGYVFDFKNIAKELYSITQNNGVVVWIVKDEASGGSESGESFRQALYFKELGFGLTTMLYTKKVGLRTGSTKFYQDNFEYVFVLTKGATHTFNPIRDKINSCKGKKGLSSKRQKDGSLKNFFLTVQEIGQRDNVWIYSTGFNNSSQDTVAFEHPAIFPEALARDHIVSWSNKGDTVFDPMSGSGTVPKMCERWKRKWLACEVSAKYCDIIVQRVENERKQLKFC